MGLIKAALGSAGGVLADQRKDYFYCESLPADVLVVKGQKRNSGRSSNTKGSDNIITNGSVININDGTMQTLYQMQQNHQGVVNPAHQAAVQNAAMTPPPQPASQPVSNGWVCSCGTQNTGKFCLECGSPKPAAEGWTCSCGAVNKGKFCPECGAKKPAGVPVYKCDKCGWEPEKGVAPPKFCPECGDRFDDGDIV
ncbi:MAG: hypothetical protein IJO54_08125 [Oscillospiraceae bacterium]|nr:hypothetical protein [Oscillospiraceae bacterium]